MATLVTSLSFPQPSLISPLLSIKVMTFNCHYIDYVFVYTYVILILTCDVCIMIPACVFSGMIVWYWTTNEGISPDPDQPSSCPSFPQSPIVLSVG